MNEAEIVQIERACQRLIVDYTHWIDFGDALRVAALFAPDGVWEMSGARYEGRAAVEEMLRGRQAMSGRRSRHVCTNVGIEVVDADHATGLVYLMLYRYDFDSDERSVAEPAPHTAPVAVGQYRDRYRRTEEGWRFAWRRAELAFGVL